MVGWRGPGSTQGPNIPNVEDAEMLPPNFLYFASVLLAYMLVSLGLQRSPLLNGPKLFFQALALALIALVAARQMAML